MNMTQVKPFTMPTRTLDESVVSSACQRQLERPQFQRLSALYFLQTNDALTDIYESCYRYDPSTDDDDMETMRKDVIATDTIKCDYNFILEAQEFRDSCKQLNTTSQFEYWNIDMECNDTVQSVDGKDDERLIHFMITMNAVPQCMGPDCDEGIIQNLLQDEMEVLTGCKVKVADGISSTNRQNTNAGSRYENIISFRYYICILSMLIIYLV